MLQTLKSIALKVISFLVLIGISVIVILQFPLNGKQGTIEKAGKLFSFLQNNDPVDASVQTNRPSDFLFADQTVEELSAKGYTLFDGVYNADTCVFGVASLTQYAYINNLPRVFINSSNNYPYLYPRMGFLYRYDTVGAKMLLDGTGKEIKTNLAEKMTFAGERDKAGTPLFTNNNQYFTYDKAKNDFVKAEFNPFTQKKGLNYDFPSYYNDISGNILHLVCVNQKYGYANAAGKIIVQARYKAGYEFSDGVGCLVDALDRLVCFDAEGSLIMSPSYYGTKDSTDATYLGYYYFQNGVVRASTFNRNQSKKSSSPAGEVILQKNGSKLPIPPDYQVYSYSDGLILLGKSGKYGYMDANGAWVIHPIYTVAKPFCEGLAVVGGTDGKFGVIDRTGKLVIPMEFDGISNSSGGVISLLQKDKGWFVLHKMQAPKKS